MLEHDLAIAVLASHPLEAARVLERLPAKEVAAFLADVGPETAAACLRVMHDPVAAETLAALEEARAAQILEALPVDASSMLLRRLSAERRNALLAAIGGREERSLRALLRFAPNTAGALMDPDVLALPVDLTVADALERVRQAANDARYNLYAVDREGRLVGAFNLRELFLADAKATLSSISRRNPHRIPAGADRHAIVSHPGWREVHALPVADANGVYLGAIRYRTLRRLEDELRGTAVESGATARALGDLFRTGATSLLEAVAASTPVAPLDTADHESAADPAAGGSHDGRSRP